MVFVVETTGYGKCLQKVIGKSKYRKDNTSGQGLKCGLKEPFPSPHLLHRLHAEIKMFRKALKLDKYAETILVLLKSYRV